MKRIMKQRFAPSSQAIRVLLVLLILPSCAVRIEPAAPRAKVATKQVTFPKWVPSDFHKQIDGKDQFLPNYIAMPEGEVASYLRRPDGTEEFVVVSQREENAKPGIFQFRMVFLPTSVFAGPSPLQSNLNELRGSRRKWIYSAYQYRSTFFQLYPAISKDPKKTKGTIVYHTSIMLLSIAEKKVVKKFRALGWNIVVALPPDSLFRTKLPAMTSPRGTMESAAKLLAEDMDRHYAEQGYATRTALAYLRRTRPDWLAKKKVLMATSAGSFGLPAEVLMNPGWDAIVITSGGTNLLETFEEGAAGVFPNALKWIADARRDPPADVTYIPSDEEYRQLYRRAAKMTKLHAGALAPLIRNENILMISGRWDRILSKSQLDGLHIALGRPERWTYPLGHHLVAVQLALEVGRIDRWLTTSFQRKPDTPSASR